MQLLLIPVLKAIEEQAPRNWREALEGRGTWPWSIRTISTSTPPTQCEQNKGKGVQGSASNAICCKTLEAAKEPNGR